MKFKVKRGPHDASNARDFLLGLLIGCSLFLTLSFLGRGSADYVPLANVDVELYRYQAEEHPALWDDAAAADAAVRNGSISVLNEALVSRAYAGGCMDGYVNTNLTLHPPVPVRGLPPPPQPPKNCTVAVQTAGAAKQLASLQRTAVTRRNTTAECAKHDVLYGQIYTDLSPWLKTGVCDGGRTRDCRHGDATIS